MQCLCTENQGFRARKNNQCHEKKQNKINADFPKLSYIRQNIAEMHGFFKEPEYKQLHVSSEAQKIIRFAGENEAYQRNCQEGK